MKKRIVTIVLLVVLTLGAFTTMAMARTAAINKDNGVVLTYLAASQDGAQIRLRGVQTAAPQTYVVASYADQSAILGNWRPTNFNDWVEYILGGCQGPT